MNIQQMSSEAAGPYEAGGTHVTLRPEPMMDSFDVTIQFRFTLEHFTTKGTWVRWVAVGVSVMLVQSFRSFVTFVT